MENVESVNCAKKYESMAETIVPILFGLLRERLALDEEIYAKEEEIRKKNLGNSEEKALWNEYKTRFSKLIEGRVSEDLKNRSHASAICSVPDFYYMNGEFEAEFTMRRANMATIITSFKDKFPTVPECNKNADGIAKHKFVMRLVDDTWILDAVYDWRFQSWRSVRFNVY